MPCIYCPNSTKLLISSIFFSIFISGTDISPLGKALKPQSHYLILIQLTTLLGSYLILQLKLKSLLIDINPDLHYSKSNALSTSYI